MFILAEARNFPVKLVQTGIERDSKNYASGNIQIIDLDLSKFDKIASRFQNSHLSGENVLKSGIQTKNIQFNKMISQIEHVSIQSKAPILLIGPTGAGKTQLARRIFDLKERRRQVEGSFVEINCATLRGDMAMSMLFGHKKGAFTGANTDREGLLLSANKGVLFLDEIGELGLDEQTMLLRALEDKRFLPVGADKEVSSNFQLIAGTNKDLFSLVTKGTFRDDLLARINLWTYNLPGLKDRKEDIEPNLEYELEKFAMDNTSMVRFNKEARKKFIDFSNAETSTWNGNFRDLSASVTRMSTLSNLGRINSEVVEEEIHRLKQNWQQTNTNHEFEYIKQVQLINISEIDLFDRSQLNEVIKICKVSKSMAEAGRKLFAVSRTKKTQSNDSDRLKKYLARFGLSWEDVI
jgi:transcriptional regulatory protein RtcR